jgi:uncharacterized repeat protein (TIGR01451 family)
MSAPWAHLSLTRRRLLGLAVVLITVVAIAVAATEPAGGQAPLACDGGLYVTTGAPDDMTLTRVDQATGALTPIGDGGLVANALGHNPEDGYLYGIDRDAPHGIVRVSAGGAEQPLGPAAGAPASWELTYVGTFLANGHYLILGDNAPAATPRGTVPGTWAEIDVSTQPPEVVRTFSHASVGNNDLQDVALDPVDGELYAHSVIRGRIVRIDPVTGAATAVGPTFATPANAGSSFFDAFGRMWLYGSGGTTGTQDTLYRIDDPTTDTPVVVADGRAVTNSDGASCPFTLGMEKTVAPGVACAGTTVTYRYEITSEAIEWLDHSSPPAGRTEAAAVNVDFEDQLPDDGRTFVAGTLVNPFGGDELPYGGTDRLVIENVDVPHGGGGTIRVDVALPATLPAGTVLNQARLTDLAGDFGVEVLSEYPGTPPYPDPTPLEVRQCADISVDKSVDVTVAGPGDELTYTVRATNHGPSDAIGVDSVADPLPAGLTFLSSEGGGRITADGTVRWPAMDLAVGEHRDMTVTARADADVRRVTGDDSDLDNTAVVRHPGDPNSDNDRDTAVVAVDHPDLVVAKDDGLTLVAPGDELTYAVDVTNTGPGDAHGVVVSDQLPHELEYVHGSEGAAYAEPGTITWPAFDLAAGEARRLTVVARVVSDVEAGTVVHNVASAPHPEDPNPEDNTDDDRDHVEDHPLPPRVEEPTPDDDPPVPWLPRTGMPTLSWATIGLGLIALGVAAHWWSRSRPT